MFVNMNSGNLHTDIKALNSISIGFVVKDDISTYVVIFDNLVETDNNSLPIVIRFLSFVQRCNLFAGLEFLT